NNISTIICGMIGSLQSTFSNKIVILVNSIISKAKNLWNSVKNDFESSFSIVHRTIQNLYNSTSSHVLDIYTIIKRYLIETIADIRNTYCQITRNAST